MLVVCFYNIYVLDTNLSATHIYIIYLTYEAFINHIMLKWGRGDNYSVHVH